MNRIAASLTLVSFAACTHWDTTNPTSTLGTRRELGRRLVGAPTVEEVTQTGLAAGVGGASSPTISGGTVALGALSAGMSTVKRRHCVQQAEIDYAQTEELEATLSKRGLDLGLSIPLLAVGLLTIASVHNAANDTDYNGNPKLVDTTPGYIAGGSLAVIGGAWLGYSVGFLPSEPRPKIAPREKTWTETAYVEAQGCGLVPGDMP